MAEGEISPWGTSPRLDQTSYHSLYSRCFVTKCFLLRSSHDSLLHFKASFSTKTSLESSVIWRGHRLHEWPPWAREEPGTSSVGSLVHGHRFRAGAELIQDFVFGYLYTQDGKRVLHIFKCLRRKKSKELFCDPWRDFRQPFVIYQ